MLFRGNKRLCIKIDSVNDLFPADAVYSSKQRKRSLTFESIMAPTTALELKFDTVDVFTTSRYTGNQLAIVHVPSGTRLTEEQKHKIAIEFNLSETVFLHENSDDPFDRRVDIFTVSGEIPFAGG